VEGGKGGQQNCDLEHLDKMDNEVGWVCLRMMVWSGSLLAMIVCKQN
jgi:hypothetical protein